VTLWVSHEAVTRDGLTACFQVVNSVGDTVTPWFATLLNSSGLCYDTMWHLQVTSM
jgi:hypothetical protein